MSLLISNIDLLLFTSSTFIHLLNSLFTHTFHVIISNSSKLINTMLTPTSLHQIFAQDDNNATETQTRMCCPCPPGVTGVPMDVASFTPLARRMEGAASTFTPLARGMDGAASSFTPLARGADGVDDCPCRARDADSEGAASLFFPHAVRPFGNVMRPDPKEESKPLLHPEVGLASSVLETLREATDEEYRDALQRDAARAAADVTSLADLIDGTPEEARNVVTVIEFNQHHPS
ncbi:uncharacterized protein LOC125236731 [Leguminivora glycinivorella]|uniref:uncharacterized protein LOC125236731 n=1 Tax=Leguminivora glycinivorella TaxID=1035111 RepID=UPI00200C8046|nr:uncharacterized protein LOC125236731 [Leguminivora glycinivorella]